MPVIAQKPPTKEVIREHYDLLSVFYKLLWGQHIHHGYWEGNESRQEAQEKLLRKLFEFAAVAPCSDVLDIGCGVGGTAIWLARNLKARVTGITISPVQKHLAIREARRAGLSTRLMFECLDASNMDRLVGTFDALSCIECSEHLPAKSKFFRDCHRLARPGGRLAICAWCVGEHFEPEEHSKLIDRVLKGMLLPSLASAADYEYWARSAGFVSVGHRDITAHVKPTWDVCDRIVHQPHIVSMLERMPGHVRNFAGAFGSMKTAYDVGAMTYNMFTARKP